MAKNMDRFFELQLNEWKLFDSITLSQSRVVISSELTPVVDFFNHREVGIGGRTADDAARELNLNEADHRKLSALLRLRSYDLYTLRAAMSSYLTDKDLELLALPDSEKKRLETYTRDYTRALFKLVFEGADVEAGDRSGIEAALKGSTREVIQRNVMALAKKFGIKPEELVTYISSLGDMLIAIAYYRRCHLALQPMIDGLCEEMRILRDAQEAGIKFVHQRRTANIILHCAKVTKLVLDSYFQGFHEIGSIWTGLTPERFRDVRDGIEAQYPSIGATLCLWQVKIESWNERFTRDGRPRDATFEQKITFMAERLSPGMDQVLSYLRSLRTLSDVFAGKQPSAMAAVAEPVTSQ